MRITTIAIKLGETVNLGNYSNYRPEISATAEIAHGENASRVMELLTYKLQSRLADLVDDALEQAEMEPKYASRLFGVRINRLRGVVLVFEKGLKLPEAKTWRDADRWERPDGLSHHMRQDTAMAAAERIEAQGDGGIALYLIEHQEDMDVLPELPDPGPEPLWSQKGLTDWLERLRVPESEWDMLAALPHVTPEHIQLVYRNSPHSTWDRLKDAILAAPQQAVPIQGVEDALERYGFSDEDRDRFLEEEE